MLKNGHCVVISHTLDAAAVLIRLQIRTQPTHRNTVTSTQDLPLFYELVACMQRIALPPVEDSHVSAPIAFAAGILRQQFEDQHARTLRDIAGLRRA